MSCLSVKNVVELKHSKARAKTAFTKARRVLLVLIQQRELTLDAIQEGCATLDMAQEEAMEAIEKLLDRFRTEKDYMSCEKLGKEVEMIEIEYTEVQNRV